LPFYSVRAVNTGTWRDRSDSFRRTARTVARPMPWFDPVTIINDFTVELALTAAILVRCGMYVFKNNEHDRGSVRRSFSETRSRNDGKSGIIRIRSRFGDDEPVLLLFCSSGVLQ